MGDKDILFTATEPYRFCPADGTELGAKGGESRGAACPTCGRSWYRSSAPAVGAAIVDGERVLVTVRGIVPGEYTVNVSHFQATTGQPVAVSVKVQKLNPATQVIFDNKLTLDHSGHEKTAVRFWLDAAGKVIDVQERQKSLMETFRNVRANGADLDPKTGVRMPRRE